MMKTNLNIFKGKSRYIDRHENIVLVFVIEGSISVIKQVEDHKLIRDNFFLVNVNESYEIKAGENSIYCEIEIDYYWVCNTLGVREIYFDVNKSVDSSNTLELEIIINQYIRCFIHKKDMSVLLGDSIFLKLIDMLINCFSDVSWDEHDENALRIREITEYIRTHYSESVKMKDLASRFYLSEAYFSRYFKKEYGTTFIEYLNKVRLDRAAAELIDTEKVITRIAVENGFSTPSVFNHKFKECYGISPKEYRKDKISKEAQEPLSDELQESVKEYIERRAIEKDKNLPIYSININADVKSLTEKKNGYRCFLNLGSFDDILKSEVQQHVIILNRKLVIEYGRLCTPFSDIMLEDFDSAAGKYDFEKLDKAIDFLLSENIIPFIELGNKPKRIQKSAREALLLQNIGKKINDFDTWEKTFNAWMKHLKSYYGEKEVSKWYFEIWRDESENEWKKNYFSIFDSAYNIIKKYFPKTNVGGYGIMVMSKNQLYAELEQFAGCKNRPDFVSTYLYAYELQAQRKDNKRSLIPDFLDKIMDLLTTGMKSIGFEDIPIIATEWNLTVSDRNIINDNCSRAAYLLNNQIKWSDRNIMIGYFYSSDSLSEYNDSKHFLYGGAGIVTKRGILKPAAYAVKYAKETLKYVIDKGKHYLVTTDNRGKYNIVCENFKQFSSLYYLREEDKISEEESIFENVEMLEFNFTLSNIKNGRYEIRRSSVNTEHGSIVDEWKKFSYTDELLFEDLEYFRHICVPCINLLYEYVENGKLNISIRLLPHEINQLQIRFLE